MLAGLSDLDTCLCVAPEDRTMGPRRRELPAVARELPVITLLIYGTLALTVAAALLGRKARDWHRGVSEQNRYLEHALTAAEDTAANLASRTRLQHWQNAIERRKRRHAEQERDNYLTIAAQHLVDLRRTRRELKVATERLALLSAEREVTSKPTPRRQLAAVKEKAG
jgi:hypothetical protein